MRSLDLTPAALTNGQVLRLSPSALRARDGALTLIDANVLEGRSRQYVAYMAGRSGSLSNWTAAEAGTVTLVFDTRRGARYLVDFALELDTASHGALRLPSAIDPVFTAESCARGTEQIHARDGHVALLISGAPAARCRVSLSSGAPASRTATATTGYPWTFFHVEVTPLR